MLRWSRGEARLFLVGKTAGLSISVLLEYDGAFLLVDAGDGTARRLAEGAPHAPAFPDLARRLVGVVLTHDHGDHVCGLPGLLWMLRRARREAPLPVALPGKAPLATGCLAAWREAYRGRERFPVEEWTHGDGVVHRMGPFEVRPFPVRHSRSASDPPGMLMDAWGMSIRVGELRVVVSGDTGPCPRLEEEVRGADLAVVEAGGGDGTPPPETHLSRAEAERIGRLAREHVLYHLP